MKLFYKAVLTAVPFKPNLKFPASLFECVHFEVWEIVQCASVKRVTYHQFSQVPHDDVALFIGAWSLKLIRTLNEILCEFI